MIKTLITDGLGTKNQCHVTPQNELLVTTTGCPATTEIDKCEIYRDFLETSAGSSDMKVNGSITNVEFYIQAADGADRYITQLSFEIADAAMTLSKFGNLAALTNGCTLKYQKTGKTVIIHDAIKSNWDLIRLCLGYPAFNDQATGAFIAANIFGSSEGIIPILDFTKLMPIYGLKLERNTNQKLIFTIRDDVSGLDSFNAIAYGFDRLE